MNNIINNYNKPERIIIDHQIYIYKKNIDKQLLKEYDNKIELFQKINIEEINNKIKYLEKLYTENNNLNIDKNYKKT